MSKERALLKRCEIAIIEGEDYLVGLLADIQELLENPEQEPVAWISKLTGFITTEDQGDTSPWVALYLAPPKPEGLTPRQGLAEYKRGYNAAVRDLKTKVDSIFNLVIEDDE